tara:strand:- start:2411 stop:2884 length:474 start_codon:yes stop_codon:yes gene_type:complete
LLKMDILQQNTTSLNKLYKVINQVFGVTKEQLAAKSRRRVFVGARSVFAVIARRRLFIGTVQLGHYLGRDHSSITHYTRKHDDLCKFDPQYKELYELCLRSFEEEFLGKSFIKDNNLNADNKLNIAYIKINVLEDENKRLKESLDRIHKNLNNIMQC